MDEAYLFCEWPVKVCAYSYILCSHGSHCIQVTSVVSRGALCCICRIDPANEYSEPAYLCHKLLQFQQRLLSVRQTWKVRLARRQRILHLCDQSVPLRHPLYAQLGRIDMLRPQPIAADPAPLRNRSILSASIVLNSPRFIAETGM